MTSSKKQFPKIAKSQQVSETISSAQPRELTPYLQVEGVNKSFGQFVALKDIFLDVYPGEFICLLGPSGCGKTTLLRIIAGLEAQTSGKIIQGGKDVSRLPASKRDFGIVFQSYALFPNLNATENIAYGLQNAQVPKEQIKTRVDDLLTLVGLEQFALKYPAQLSGGQQQRVAIARAIALSPGLLLLDEPLSALDAQVRVKLRTEITQLQRRLGITTIMVTHDQAEALAMADRIVVMDKGYIAQVGNPRGVYQNPHTPFVANFIGVMNFLEGVMISPEQVRAGNIIFQVPPQVYAPNTKVSLAIRPEEIQVLNGDVGENQPNQLKAQIETVEYLGSIYRLSLLPEGNGKDSLLLEISSYQTSGLEDLTPGASINIYLPSEQIQIFTS